MMLAPTEKALHYKFYGDAYYACGAHMIGGSFFVDRVLSWRGVRPDNTAHPAKIVSPHQMALKSGFESKIDDLKKLAVESLFCNGIEEYLSVANLGEIVTTHFPATTLASWRHDQPRISDLLMRFAANLDWTQ